jgi:membrane-bound metal-dependent hydrolase YbcI (DUF457 family)
MDPLTHLFLPVTIAYVLDRERFPTPIWLVLGVLGVLPDVDKFLGVPGLFHSLVTLVPVSVAVLLFERCARGRIATSPIIVALLCSHVVIDFIDGGPVQLLYPFVRTGIGLRYPAQVLFGTGPLGVTIQGPLVTVQTAAARSEFNTYGFLNAFGVTSALTFLFIYVGLRRRRRTEGVT